MNVRLRKMKRPVLRSMMAVAVVALAARGVNGQEAFQGRDFSRLIAIRELAPDSLLVVDEIEKSVSLIQWDAPANQRSVVLEGPGPLEVRGFGRVVAIDGSRTLLMDAFDGDWVVLTGAEPTDGRRPESNTFVRLAGADLLGHVLTEERVGGLEGAATHRLRDHEGYVVEDVITTELRSRGGPWVIPAQGDRPAIVFNYSPLTSMPVVSIAPDGWVAVVSPDPYRVEWRNPAGDWIRGPEIERLPTVSRADRCAALSVLLGAGPCWEDEIEEWPERMPAFVPEGPAQTRLQALHSSDGRLLIHRLGGLESGMNRYDLVDREGHRVDVLALGLKEFVLGFGSDSVYWVRVGAFDTQTLHREPWSAFIDRTSVSRE